MIDLTNFDDFYTQLKIGESDQIEAKEAKNSVGKSVLETISAFSNEPGLGGGILLLGIKEENEGTRNFVISGVLDSENIQNEVASLCRTEFNHEIRPRIKVAFRDNKRVVIIHIPEANPLDKPIYIKSRGREKGAFRRIGSSDQLCTERDLDYLYQMRSKQAFEEKIIDYTSWDDIDPNAIKEYRRIRNEIKSDASELSLDDHHLLLSLRIAVQKGEAVIPSIAGLLLFGKPMSLKGLLPMSTRIDYIFVEGTEWVPDPQHRYHSIEFQEPLVTAFNRIVSDVMSDIPKAFSLSTEHFRRVDIPAIPRDVVREAIANLLMHRDYSSSSPSQIIRYANRLEFRNPGYSLKESDQLGQPGSAPRNPKISNIFHDLTFAETKGTGIRSMQKAMINANLSVPLMESSRGANLFTLTLLSHHLFDERDIKWLEGFKEFNLSAEEAKALIVIREMGAITNADYRVINNVDTLTASSSLRKLRDLDLLHMKGQGNKTYYMPTVKLFSESKTIGTPDITTGTPDITTGTPDITTGTPDIMENNLPDKVRNKVQKLTKRTPRSEIKSLILEICSIRPYNANELGSLIKRDSEYLRNFYLTRMIESGELEYLYPSNPAHPGQAYITARIHG